MGNVSVLTVGDARSNLEAVELALVKQADIPVVVFTPSRSRVRASKSRAVVFDGVATLAFARLVAALADRVCVLQLRRSKAELRRTFVGVVYMFGGIVTRCALRCRYEIIVSPI